VRDALQKHYHDFWIAIVPSNPELTWLRMMRVSSTCLLQCWWVAALLYFPFALVNSLFFDEGLEIIGVLGVILTASVFPMVALRIALRKNYGDFRLALVPPKVDESREWSKEQKTNVIILIAAILCALCVAVIILAISEFVRSGQIPWQVQFFGTFVGTLLAISVQVAIFRRH
jgi:hypothetical protein